MNIPVLKSFIMCVSYIWLSKLVSSKEVILYAHTILNMKNLFMQNLLILVIQYTPGTAYISGTSGTC